MGFLIVGLLLVTMKLLEFGPVAGWDWAGRWYLFAAPFILAVIWWAWADNSGYTKRKEMEKMEQVKKDRLAKNRAKLGIETRKK